MVTVCFICLTFSQRPVFPQRKHKIYGQQTVPNKQCYKNQKTIRRNNNAKNNKKISEHPQYYEYFKDIQERLLPADGSAYCRKMTDEDFYLFILAHTCKHYSRGGTGLRSLLDVYMFLCAHPDLDRAYLNAELDKLELTGFEEKLRRLSQKVFTSGTLDKYEQNDLAYLISSGSAGTCENQEYNQMAIDLGGDDSKASKRRLLKSRFFISGEALEKNYPFFAKHKALYPLLLLYRPVKGAVTHPKGILAEYKKIKNFKKKEEP